MRVYRVARRPHAKLTGEGGNRADGRWHTRPRPILYASTEPGLAALETLVHLELGYDELPSDFVMIAIDLPTEPSKESPALDVHDVPACQSYGNGWLDSQRSLAVHVPTVLVPFGQNVLINGGHPERDSIAKPDIRAFDWDSRLFRPRP